MEKKILNDLNWIWVVVFVFLLIILIAAFNVGFNDALQQ